RTSSFASTAPKKIASLFSSVRPITTSAAALRSSRMNSGSPTATTDTRHFGFTPSFSSRVRCLNRSALLSFAAFLGATRRLQQGAPRRVAEPLDGVAHGRPRDRRPVGAKMALQPRRVGLAGFPKRPSDRLLNQVLPVGMQAQRDRVDEIEGLAPPGQRNQADDRGAAHPHVAIA